MRLKFATASCLLFLLAMGFSGLKAQTVCSYQIVSESTYSVGQMNNALGSANLDAYRKTNIRRTIVFENGAEVILFSANELVSQGCAVNTNVVMADNTPIDVDRVFSIHSSGLILEKVERKLK